MQLTSRQRYWVRRIWWLLTLVLVFAMAFHPALRLLAPVLDTVGLDLLMLLLGAQLLSLFSDVLVPMLLRLMRDHLAPALRWISARSRSQPRLAALRSAASHALRRGRWPRAAWVHLHVLWWRWVSVRPLR